MKKKAEKIRELEEWSKNFRKSESVILANFSSLPANEVNTLRASLRAAGAVLRVMKKRLLKILLEREGVALKDEIGEGQTGVIFSPKDMLETSGVACRFAKGRETFRIFGGVEVGKKKAVSAADVIRLGQLPSREILLGQLVGMLVSPIRSFLLVLNERAQQTPQ